jgi:hypothetical protein
MVRLIRGAGNVSPARVTVGWLKSFRREKLSRRENGFFPGGVGKDFLK